MKTVFFSLLFLLALSPTAKPQGRIIEIKDFKSDFVKSRNIEIWLPDEYFEDTDKRFPVLYMHDGQNVFNTATAMNNTSWGADRTATRLIEGQKVEPFIIVAVWNTNARYFEYFPENAAQYLSAEDSEQIEKVRQQAQMPKTDWLGNEYLSFLVDELKPYIDEKYRTLINAKNTSIAGSSMGGLISMYAALEYPNVFGQAACVSTHWPVLFNNDIMGPSEAIRKYMEEKMPAAGTNRFYFDYGTATLDQYYEVHQKQVNGLMRNKGYAEGKDWVTRKFEGAEHNEKAWQERFDVILTFLYGK